MTLTGKLGHMKTELKHTAWQMLQSSVSHDPSEIMIWC